MDRTGAGCTVLPHPRCLVPFLSYPLARDDSMFLKLSPPTLRPSRSAASPFVLYRPPHRIDPDEPSSDNGSREGRKACLISRQFLKIERFRCIRWGAPYVSVFSDEEGSAQLDRIAVELELEKLSPINRALIQLRFAYRIPDDYTGLWPADYRATGTYVGHRYLGRSLSATRIQHRTTHVLTRWQRWYHVPSVARAPLSELVLSRPSGRAA